MQGFGLFPGIYRRDLLGLRLQSLTNVGSIYFLAIYEEI
jgi:hypothetical protein